MRVGRGNFDPPLLLPGDDADFIGYLGKVLIPAEEESDVELLLVGEPDDIHRNPNVDSLLVAVEKAVSASVG